MISYTLTDNDLNVVWSLVKNNNKTDNKLYSSVRNFSYITVRKQLLDLPPLSLLLNVLKAKVIRTESASLTADNKMAAVRKSI